MKLAPAQAASSDLLNVPPVSTAGSARSAAQFATFVRGLLQSAPRTMATPSSTDSGAQRGPSEKVASPDQAAAVQPGAQDATEAGPIVLNVNVPGPGTLLRPATAASPSQTQTATGSSAQPRTAQATNVSASATGEAKAAAGGTAQPGARISTGEPVAAGMPTPALASATTAAAAMLPPGASLASAPDLPDGADAGASAAHDPTAGARQGSTTASAQAPTEDAASLPAATQPPSSPLHSAEGLPLPSQAASQSDRMPASNSAPATPAAAALASPIAANPAQALDATFPMTSATRTTAGQSAGGPSDLPQAVRIGPVLQHADGSQTIVLQLHPASLGRVTAIIEHASGDMAPRLVLTAEKPETLALLTRDNATLQQVLDQAGVPREGRSVSFQPALPEAAQPHAAVHAELTSSAPQTPSASADPNASQQRDQRSPARRPRPLVPASAIRSAGDPAAAANVDITA